MMSMTMIVLQKVFKERTMVQNKFTRYSNLKIKKEDDNFPKIIIDACQVSPFQLVTITII